MCQLEHIHYLNCPHPDAPGKYHYCLMFRISRLERLTKSVQHCGDLSRITTEASTCPKCSRSKPTATQKKEVSSKLPNLHLKGKAKETTSHKASNGSIRVLQETSTGSTGFTPSVSPARQLASAASYEFGSPHLSKHAPARSTATATKRRPVPTSIPEEDAPPEVYARAAQGAMLASMAAGSLAASQRADEKKEEEGLKRRNAVRAPEVPRHGRVGRGQAQVVHPARSFHSARGSIAVAGTSASASRASASRSRSPSNTTSLTTSRASASRTTTSSRAPASPPLRATSSRSAPTLTPPSSLRSVPARKPLPSQTTPGARTPSSSSQSAFRHLSAVPAPLNLPPPPPAHQEVVYETYNLSGAELDPELMRRLRPDVDPRHVRPRPSAPEEYIVSPVESDRGSHRFPVSPITSEFESSSRSDPFHPSSYRRRVERGETPTSRRVTASSSSGQATSSQRRVPSQSATNTPSRSQSSSSRTPTSSRTATTSSPTTSRTRSTSRTATTRSPTQSASSSRGQPLSSRERALAYSRSISSRPQEPTATSTRERPSRPAPAPAPAPTARPSRFTEGRERTRDSAAIAVGVRHPPSATRNPRSATKSRTKKFLELITGRPSLGGRPKGNPKRDGDDWVCKGSASVERR